MLFAFDLDSSFFKSICISGASVERHYGREKDYYFYEGTLPSFSFDASFDVAKRQFGGACDCAMRRCLSSRVLQLRARSQSHCCVAKTRDEEKAQHV